MPIFLKGHKETPKITTISSQNAYEKCKIMDFCNLMNEAGKKYRIIYKVLIFNQTYLKFDDCHDKVKTVGGALDIKTSADNK